MYNGVLKMQVHARVTGMRILLLRYFTSVMADVVSNGLQLIGTGRSPLIDIRLKNSLEAMTRKAKGQTLTKREKLHVNAVELLAEGFVQVYE